MSTSRFAVWLNRRSTSVVGRWSLATATLLVLWLGGAEVARAEKDCPPACVTCRAKGGAWVNNFCFLPIQPDKNVLSTLDIEDPILVI